MVTRRKKPDKKQKGAMIKFRLPDDIKDKFFDFCRKQMVSPSAQLRMMIAAEMSR